MGLARGLTNRLRGVHGPVRPWPGHDAFRTAPGQAWLRASRLPRRRGPAAYRAQQEFLSTAAHELKTPLALIRAQVELREDGRDHGSLLDDVEHMARQVQQLLLPAEASETRGYRFAAVDVREVVREAAGYLRRMADATGVRLSTPEAARGAPVVWQADRGALFTLLKNLLENAIQHAPAGSEVGVEVDGGALTVRDRGPGVDEASLPLLFDRFWRGAHRRDHGAGLGLAICREIALAHGWRLSAERAGPGLSLRVSLGAEGEGCGGLSPAPSP